MADDACAEYRTPQRAGMCFLKGVLEAIRYLCRQASENFVFWIDHTRVSSSRFFVNCIAQSAHQEGLSRAHTKQLSFALRRAMLHAALADLTLLDSASSSSSSPRASSGDSVVASSLLRRRWLNESDIMLLRIAAKQTARAAVKEVLAAPCCVGNRSSLFISFCILKFHPFLLTC